jgi:hypothetical protein
MSKFLCWLLGHDRMATSARQRLCLRCGTRETLRYFSSGTGWEEMTRAASQHSQEYRALYSP